MERNSFGLFIDLITFDQSLYKTEKELRDVQSEIDYLTDVIEGFVATLEKGKETVRQMRKDVDIKELEMKELDEKEKQTRTRLDKAANEKDYQAFKDEISTLKKKQHDYEATLMEVWNLFENAQKEFVKKEQEVAAEKEAVEKNLQEKQSKAAELKATLDGAAQERLEKEKNVPEEWIGKYSRMRNSVENPVVTVVNGSCSACFYKIPDQDALSVNQQQLIECKGCYRFLYGDDTPEGPAQEHEPSEVAASE